MENQSQERMLAFLLATEITPQEMEQVSGGSMHTGTNQRTHFTTRGGLDHNFDMDSD